jgi:S-DNA-T family DNA segregation ATPase FtsK/SpoIIIE
MGLVTLKEYLIGASANLLLASRHQNGQSRGHNRTGILAQAQRIKTNPPAIRLGILRFFNGILREISFWLMVAIALGMIGALATFDLQDPAWTQTAEVARLHNLGGTVGAWFADVTLYFFGYPAVLLPLGVAFAGWRLFKCGTLLELDAEIVLFRVLGFAVALATACGLAALHLRVFPGTVPGDGTAGGLVGVYVSRFLVQAFGFAGGNLFMVGLLLAGSTLMTGVPWLTMVDWMGAALLKVLDGAGWLVIAPLRWMMGRKARGAGEAERVEDEASLPEVPGADSVDAPIVKAKTGMEQWRPILAHWAGLAVEKPLAWWRTRHKAKKEDAPLPAVMEESSLPPVRIEPVFNSQAESQEAEALREAESISVSVTPLTASEAVMDVTLVPSSPLLERSNVIVHSPRPDAGKGPGERAVDSATAPLSLTLSPLPRREGTEHSLPLSALLSPRPPILTPSPLAGEGGGGGGGERVGVKEAPSTPVAVMVCRRASPPLVAPFALPPLDLLDPPPPRPAGTAVEVLEGLSRRVESLLKSFGIEVRVVAVEPGPVITRFEVEPAPGVKVNQISNLAKDLARGLSVISVRVVEIIPGKSVIGLEIPNQQREVVYLREVLESAIYDQSASPLTLALGKDISGHPTMANLAKMPHLLVAGTTGSGKSVAINAMLLSLLYKASPSEVRLILVDPKMLELSIYEDIPHLLTPVVTDMKEAANALRWCVAEMDRRYRLMATLKVRNIAGFNRKVQDALAAGEGLADPFWTPDRAETPGEMAVLQPLPFIVVVIDELADMMMIVGKKVEELIARLAQKARAAGIHLILATQRPSVDVITGLIKANIPTRVAFQVSSRVDSRTILDQMGAEQLLGHGDMLYLPPGTGLPQRVHGAFVDDHEVNRVVDYLRQAGAPDYIDEVLAEPREEGDSATSNGDGDGRGESDPLYDEAVRLVTESRRASVSGVQRRLRIGYNRAARLVEEMEAAGVVGSVQPNGSREVLAPPGGDIHGRV